MLLRAKPSALAGILAPLVTIAILLAAAPADAAPTCAEGPQIVGATYFGTPCDDTIRAPRNVTTVFGEGGDDTLYGQRGNDSLFGGEGNDRLYGGVGDDRLRGGVGADHLSGGFGADSLDGEAGNDFARGDATIDAIADTGGGTDTLSYATGAVPGFFDRPGVSDYAGFPASRDDRGAYVNLQTGLGDNGLAPAGGGVDEELEGASFETVIGSAFPDFIVGTSDAETIYGGGGADVILGEGGADVAFGGADGDSCDAPTTFECETDEEEVDLRDPGAIAVGLMTPPGDGKNSALYLTGSDEDDEVTASYAAGSVTFTLGAGSDAGFDTSASADGACGDPAGGKVVCPAGSALDSIVLAGLDGDDTLSVSSSPVPFPDTTAVILLGGDGADHLNSGPTEDALVDGPGTDAVDAGARDDAVPNNEGADELHAGTGEDLFISNSVCDGDLLDGGTDRDNANWANFNSAIAIDMGAKKAGLVGAGGQPQCASNALLATLEAIEDVEGSNKADVLLGDSGPNQLLGRLGADAYFAAAGNDSILANSGDSDPAIDCGEGFDTAQIDIPTGSYEDTAPDENCEVVEERGPNSFRPPDTPPDPAPESEPEPRPESQPPDGGAPTPSPVSPPSATQPPQRQLEDGTPPRTRILQGPQGRIFSNARIRRVVFRFSSNEPGSSFRCKLDKGPVKPCRSPSSYLVRLGRHTVRVFAVDAAGNRDPSPALFRFQVRRR
ncbi:MAG TPA: calcium-binding protein [Solirubrobacterales bacterium]|nr:calcium-binding protein [Solirubrobacterales bacterium]